MHRLLYVTNSSQPGGMEKQVLDLINGLTKLDYKVDVWCPDGPLVKDYRAAGAEVTLKKIRIDIDPFYILSLYRYIKSNKIEILHGHELKAVTNMLFAGTLARVKIRISHTHTPISTWRIPKIMRYLSMLGYTFIVNLFSTKEIALTDSIRKIKEQEGINPYKLVVIPNGIEINRYIISDQEKTTNREELFKRYNIPKASFVIGNLSRLTVEKGYNILIDAFSKLDIPNKFLLIAGGGEQEQVLRAQISRLNLKDKVVITGIFAEEDKLKLLSALDVLAFTSFAEGFGYTFVESMVFEVPVVVSDLEVLKEVGGKEVNFFKTGDSESLEHELKRVYENQESTKLNAKKASMRARSLYSLETFLTNYDMLYRGEIK